ncbi:MAG: hypothetical protein IKC18_05460 [Bacteroidaceae bacterium]|nr:hypothetical protein [Bacteroidaceae bacterium]
MKKVILFLFCFLSCSISMMSQEQEKAYPLLNAEIVRNVAILDIEGETYFDVEMTFKSNRSVKSKVKIFVKEKGCELIWQKTLKYSYLYVFSNGQVQVGRPNFHQVLIQKSKNGISLVGKIREKEGVF